MPEAHLGARDLWARILAVDERSHEYFAERTDWPGAALFTNPGAPPFNLAVIGEATEDAATGLPERIAGHYHGLGLACRVRVTPLSLPADWPDRLAARGFRHLADEDEEFMLFTGPWREPAAAGVEVRQVTDEIGLAEFVCLQQTAWEMPADDNGRALRLARRASDAGLYRYFMARLNGRLAGAASARFEKGLAGIYGVATLQEARRRGVGASLVGHMVEEGRREGCKEAFLSAEPEGYAAGLYRRLGFVSVFCVRNYELPVFAAAG